MNKEEIQEILEELHLVRPEILQPKAKKLFEAIMSIADERDELQQRIEKAIEYIEKDTRWFCSEYASIYGELCTCAGARDDRLEVMVNPSNLLEILQGQ